MNLHERFQAFCGKCFRVFEEDSGETAIRAALQHEATCQEKPTPVIVEKVMQS